MVYVIILIAFGLAGGIVGKLKGGSFVLWFLISACVPVFGLLAAIFSRWERNELRRRCPGCDRVVKMHNALCTRCGTELEFPEAREVVPPESLTPRPRTPERAL